MSREVAGFSVSDAKAIHKAVLQRKSVPQSVDLSFEQTDGWFLAFTTGGASARSGSTLGSGTADLKYVDDTNAIVNLGLNVTFYNYESATVAANTYIWLHRYGPRFVVTSVSPSASDTLETFQMTSNWLGGIATATFTNLSEPAYGTSAGILEDPEGIFVDILGAGGRGLSIRTRYGRHYVIQAKCAQTLTPPASTGACEVYIEGEGVACVITTEAACDAVGGTFDGVGTTCP